MQLQVFKCALIEFIGIEKKLLLLCIIMGKKHGV